MRVIAWLLVRMVAIRFFAILIGVTLFVLSLDVVSYGPEILALKPGDLSILAIYFVFRAPETLVAFLPISMLLAMLLTMTELSYRNEVPALWSIGLSPVQLNLLLLPLAIVTGGIHFLLNDYAIPVTTPTLREWGIGDFGKEKFKVGEKDPIWMRAGTDILRAALANRDSTELKDVIIFRRDADGLLREQVYAKGAALEGGRWTLNGVTVYYRGNEKPDQMPTLVYSGSIRPAAAGARSGDPGDMTLSDLGYFIENGGFGIRPVWVYETWWHKRVSLAFSTLLMIALCVPLLTRFRRGGGLGVLFGIGVGIGFVYFVVDGIAVTMGEIGLVRPWLAAWLPTLGFGAIAAAMTMRSNVA